MNSEMVEAQRVKTPLARPVEKQSDAIQSDNGDSESGDSEEESISLLHEDAEVEELLRKPRLFESIWRIFKADQDDETPVKVSRNEERRQRRQEQRTNKTRRKSHGNEDGILMFEMEEGMKDTGSRSSTDSLDIDRPKWAGHEKKSTRAICKKLTLMHLIILLAFLALGLGAAAASKRRTLPAPSPSMLSNGTHMFAPTTILISLDGFRADFLNRGITPALNAFVASGVSPRYMIPSFPSVTFSNHFTMVTGLYPESHGIVGNQFWDPALKEEFFYTNESVSMQPHWWTAEPLWVTAEHQGVRTAIHMWPGSEAHIPDIEPTYLDNYNGSETLDRKVDRILGWLDLPGDKDKSNSRSLRPGLIQVYVPDVDRDGHLYGPNSTEIRATIADADSMLTMLVEGLLARNLTEIINIIIVSDHGMATTSTTRLIQLDDLIDLSLVDHIDGWPLRGLRLKDPERDLPIIHEQLLAQARRLDSFDVYTKETMPARYHFTKNDRIAPLWIVPKTGWGVVEKTDFNVAEGLANNKSFDPHGMHGYDHEHPLMRAIFIARGPAFPHAPNSRVSVFQNIEVYNIVCDSLGIKPLANNGTLRLPLKTEGLHSDAYAPQLETPSDPEPGSDFDGGPIDVDRPDVASPPGFHDKENAEGDLDPAAEKHGQKQPEKNSTSWWDFVHGELQKAKDWAKGVIDSIKDNKRATKIGKT